MSVFERMTYKIYPHPPNYFITLSNLKESRFFSYHPPTFSDNVTRFFWTSSLSDYFECEVCGKRLNKSLDIYLHIYLTCFEGHLPPSSEKIQLNQKEGLGWESVKTFYALTTSGVYSDLSGKCKSIYIKQHGAFKQLLLMRCSLRRLHLK